MIVALGSFTVTRLDVAVVRAPEELTAATDRSTELFAMLAPTSSSLGPL